jgi:hypothetical protein
VIAARTKPGTLFSLARVATCALLIAFAPFCSADGNSDSRPSSDAGSDVRVCLQGEQAASNDTIPGSLCACAGRTCTDERCRESYFSEGPAITQCECIDSVMACCWMSLSRAEGGCDYAGQTAPECPQQWPVLGEACDRMNVCAYWRSNCRQLLFCHGTWQRMPTDVICDGGAADGAASG